MEGSALRGVARVRGCRHVLVWKIKKFVDLDHVFQHVVRPLEDLGANVVQEGIRRPSTHDHDLCRGVVHQEQGHGCSRTDGFAPNFMRVKSEFVEAA